jgi:thiol:disulfide interchange protein DsbD
MPDTDAFAMALSKGPLYAGLMAFVGGLLVCLTPCVYPMIVITVSVFGARQTSSRAQAMALSSAFVLGIVTMFVPLGVGAALTGNLFGSQLSSPFVTWLVAAVFLALAASMFGLWNITLPGALVNRLAKVGGAGYTGAFLLGLVSGIVAAPCSGPVLGGILIWIGKTRSVGLGAAAMAAFAIGLGLPFWLVGTFAMRIPRSGPWMVTVKTVCGIALAAVALWLLRTKIPLERLTRPGIGYVALMAVLALLGLFAAAVRTEASRPVTQVRKAAGIAACTLALALGAIGWQMPPDGIAWRRFSQTAVADARASQRPLLIDFTADWCASCQELARHTFSAGDVVAGSRRFERLRVDATNEDDPAVEAILRSYRVRGLPTVLVIDGQGQERARITDFVSPGELLLALGRAR